MIELPDWLKGVVLLGKYGATYVPVAVDASGNMYILMQGATPGGGLATIAVDALGQAIMVPRGQSGNYMAVDANGFLTAVLKALGADAALHTLASDNNGQLIMVPRGSSGNYMNVDASGFLTTILKGIYAGNLSTVAVDSAGRMVGVIPDVGGGWNSDVYIGLGELAARLGGLQRWDARGQLLYGLDFATGIPLNAAITLSAGCTITHAVGYGYNGGYCADFYTPAIASRLAELAFGVAPTASTKNGLEITFNASAQAGTLSLRIEVYTGANEYDYRIDWNLFSGAFQYMDSNGAMQNVPGVSIPLNTYTGMSSFKLAVNSTTVKYMRMLANNQQVDLSAYSGRSGAVNIQPQIIVRTRLTSYSVVAVHVYVDNVVVTHNEPT